LAKSSPFLGSPPLPWIPDDHDRCRVHGLAGGRVITPLLADGYGTKMHDRVSFTTRFFVFMSAKSLNTGVQDRTIKRVLRHRNSREYFKDGNWTSDPAEASSFSDIVEVAETCARYGLSDVELALQYDPGGCEVFCTFIR
jgi:hypothetical protein